MPVDNRGALLAAEVTDGQSMLWQEAPCCWSWDNLAGTGGAELYGLGLVVPMLSGRHCHQHLGLLAIILHSMVLVDDVFFHSKLLPS